MPELEQDERVAVARLRALLELLPTALDRELAAEGITSFEFTLLEALHEADAGRLRLSALAARTNATLPRLSRVVTSLERKGLVLRAACEEDGRATNALLTPAGERAYEASRPRHDEAVRRMIFDGLGDGGAERLSEISYAILDKLDPDRRLAVTADGCAADPTPAEDAGACAADPAPR
ncbi:MarR family transcriptional regulator [Microbacterium sp. Marseille-Q6648]|jgi:DNA-binding MarR family transcriptional regulator|uniref:MarR family winged helix-turn-helix transcriptional regulator n=1 Tax=Microbacterium sp. Marseille-Q6648 TaxID=2937991 RepID=UPI0020424B9F|nr:MarR family transcriptional regulator [Microbacterium sp. Marseille-Q6648]